MPLPSNKTINPTPPVSPIETLVGAIVLTILLVIAGVVLYVQDRHFNPAVALVGQSVPASAPASRPLIDHPREMAPLSAAQTFGPATLADKINGKAELYLGAGFVALDTQRFAVAAPGNPWVEVFRYDMGRAENAYAVFSSQRRQDAGAVAIGDEAYAAANALFVINGPFYIEIIASQEGPAIRQAMEALALAMAGPAQQTGKPADTDVFPAQGLLAGSISLQAANAFGFDRLDRVFTAHYSVDGAPATVFFSRRDSAAQARDLAAAYVAFLKNYGGISQPTAAPDGQMIAIMEAYELVFTFGPFLAGVHEAADPRTAEILAERLRSRLTESGHGP
jgi:hypothetical protein